MKTNGEHVPTAPAPDVRAEGPLATGERFRPMVLAAITLVLVGLCIWLSVPFKDALAWAVALAIIAWPLHTWFSRKTQRLSLAAGLTTLTAVVVIIVPGMFVTYRLAREAGSAVEQARQQQAEDVVHDKMAETPGLRPVVDWMDRTGVNIDSGLRQLVTDYTRSTSSLLDMSLNAAVQFAVMLYVLFHLFRDRASLMRGIRSVLPTSPAESEKLFNGVANSVYANVYATFVTSLIDGIGGGILFWILGLPSPVTWGVVMFVLSIIPVLGTWIVWLPAGAYLVFTGRWPQALILLTWGAASAVVVDYIIYARLAGERMRLHEVPTLIAFLGGLVLFGPSGMILGPAILAVTVAVLEVWHRRANSDVSADVNSTVPREFATPPDYAASVARR